MADSHSGPLEPTYFQRLVGGRAGVPTRIGLFRRTRPDDPGADEMFDPYAGDWMPIADLRTMRAAGEHLVEVGEYDARQFLLRTMSDRAAHAVLTAPTASPATERPRQRPWGEADGVRAVRASRQYVTFDGEDYESAHGFRSGVYPPDLALTLYASATGGKLRIAPSQVEAMTNVRTHALHRDHWFVLTDLATEDGRIRGPVPFGAPRVIAGLYFEGPGWETVLGFPGARRLHDRPGEQTDEVVLDVPLTEIDDVAEERFVMRPEES